MIATRLSHPLLCLHWAVSYIWNYLSATFATLIMVRAIWQQLTRHDSPRRVVVWPVLGCTRLWETVKDVSMLQFPEETCVDEHDRSSIAATATSTQLNNFPSYPEQWSWSRARVVAMRAQVAVLVGLLLLLLRQRHGQQPGPGRGGQRGRARVPAHRGRPRPAPAGQVSPGVANI